MSAVDTKMQKLVDKLDDYRPDQIAEVEAMQKSLKLASLKKNFKEHPAMQLMLASLKKKADGYTLVLANNADIDEMKRREYFARRDEVRFVLGMFDVDQTIESIEKRLDEELNYQLSDSVDSESVQ